MDLRWHLRLDNFASTLVLLEEATAMAATRTLTDLGKAGLIQRFEICWELGWKTVRDYLADSGWPLSVGSPINAIRAGAQFGLIADPDAWVEAMRARNEMADEYDCKKFEATVARIALAFVPLLGDLRMRLDQERAIGN